MDRNVLTHRTDATAPTQKTRSARKTGPRDPSPLWNALISYARRSGVILALAGCFKVNDTPTAGSPARPMIRAERPDVRHGARRPVHSPGRHVRTPTPAPMPTRWRREPTRTMRWTWASTAPTARGAPFFPPRCFATATTAASGCRTPSARTWSSFCGRRTSLRSAPRGRRLARPVRPRRPAHAKYPSALPRVVAGGVKLDSNQPGSGSKSRTVHRWTSARAISRSSSWRDLPPATEMCVCSSTRSTAR